MDSPRQLHLAAQQSLDERFLGHVPEHVDNESTVRGGPRRRPRRSSILPMVEQQTTPAVATVLEVGVVGIRSQTLDVIVDLAPQSCLGFVAVKASN